jgi:hypothetical protein
MNFAANRVPTCTPELQYAASVSQLQLDARVKYNSSFGRIKDSRDAATMGVVQVKFDDGHVKHLNTTDIRVLPSVPYAPFKCFEGLPERFEKWGCLRCTQSTQTGLKSLRGTDHALDTVAVGSLASVLVGEGATTVGVVVRAPYRSAEHQFYLDLRLGSAEVKRFEYSEVADIYHKLSNGQVVRSVANAKKLGHVAGGIYQREGENVVDVLKQFRDGTTVTVAYKLSDLQLISLDVDAGHDHTGL